MDDWIKIQTTAEVWAVIRARHHEQLEVFASASFPDGHPMHGPSDCSMYTLYGFKGADFPFMGAETTWTKNQEKPSERIDEEHEYWLCLNKEQEEF